MKRRKPPESRAGKIRTVTIAGLEVTLETGEYEDGSLCEIKVIVGKEGGALRELDVGARGFSLALQYGAPVELIVEHMVYHETELGGVVKGCQIKLCKSIWDWVGRYLRNKYVKGTQ